MFHLQALLYCENPKDVEEITRRTIVFARSLKLHLRYDADKDEVAYKEVRSYPCECEPFM
jgi:hypothetical protein